MSLYQSLYETALKQGLPRSIIEALTRVFANDADFQRATAPGDAIEAFYSEPDDVDPRPELLSAAMTVRDQTFKYYRFQTPDDNMVDYYDENGRSTWRTFPRKRGKVSTAWASRWDISFFPATIRFRWARRMRGGAAAPVLSTTTCGSRPIARTNDSGPAIIPIRALAETA